MANCTWEDVGIDKNAGSVPMPSLDTMVFNDAAGQAQLDQLDAANGGTGADGYPGALNAGWGEYFEWADKNHQAWNTVFMDAECQRIKESKRWLAFYEKVYNNDHSWLKKTVMFALNGIQLWALYRQYRQQKKIAEQTYDLANRQQNIAEELFGYYKEIYYPHEIKLGEQIQDYFDNPACIDYDLEGDKLEGNMRIAFARAKADLLRCTSSVCGVMSANDMKHWAVEEMQMRANARNHAFRYAETKKESKDNFWLDIRLKYIQMGSAVSRQGQEGLFQAFNTFKSFGADPGAAMASLLGSISNLVGQFTTDGIKPNGRIDKVGMDSVPYHIFLGGVNQTGDVQQGKVTKRTTVSY